jgi:cation transport ATPase
VLGSVLLGISIGLYKRIANASKPATPRYCTMHVFFFSVLSLTVTPYLKFPSVANQIRSEHASDYVNGTIDPSITASYYENRWSAIIYFIVNGILLTIVIYSIANALQHAKLKESSLNSTFTGITLLTCFAFDNWVLLRKHEVVYFSKAVNFLILCLISGYFLLQYYKQQAVKDRLQ